MRLGETPVPIPNTMVKPQTADGTALVTVWESRWPPNLKTNEHAEPPQKCFTSYRYRQPDIQYPSCQPNQQGSAV